MKMLGIEILLTTKNSDCIIVILHFIYQNVQLEETETLQWEDTKNVDFNNEKTINIIIIEHKKSEEN